MPALLLCLLLGVEAPKLLSDQAMLSVALVPTKPKVVLTDATVKKALEPLGAKKGRTLKVEAVKRVDYPGLGDESLEYTAVGLPDADRKKLEASDKAVSVKISWPRSDASALREVYDALVALAAPSEAIIFDRNGASAFTAATWKTRRIEGGWNGKLPVGPMHFQVHMVLQDSGLVMLDTGGLPRFGIEDFELIDVNRASIRPAGNLVNAIAQRLIEGAKLDAKGRLTLRVSEIEEQGLRERTKEQSFPNAKGVLVVGFVPADMSRGAREGALELSFPDVPGKDRGEKLDGAVKALFGWSDSTTAIDHDEEKVKLAKARAIAALRGYEAKVKKGLPDREVLLVKAPFRYADGNEWMWVDVQSWEGKKLKGRLENEPEMVTGLKAGQTVEVNLEQVMDYMYKLPDDTFYGNEVGRVVRPEMFEELGKGRVRLKQ